VEEQNIRGFFHDQQVSKGGHFVLVYKLEELGGAVQAGLASKCCYSRLCQGRAELYFVKTSSILFVDA
jgi:hypothetical protein